ncbi:MAG: hypothetical protein E5W91_08155 [Mesorhizobium sp.]|uniref:hypothetical protein n=1 Tax=Mesorhizobium sp. TaxID=1871066 RepID=UPI0012156D82|nr:hypothetical protein [Mesorhizobium sp.]TIS58440.1 MAG: hypothetical protein E5W91_08155 [Mesorhizobium sp.]
MRATPYNDRSDIDKIQSQWNKIGGLLSRRDWSAAIVRASTAAEIAANIAVRKKFAAESHFSADFVSGLLKRANGIKGKFSGLIVPAENDDALKAALVALEGLADNINQRRNAIVHQGAFSEEPEAREVIGWARQIINGLVLPHHPDFILQDKPTTMTP